MAPRLATQQSKGQSSKPTTSRDAYLAPEPLGQDHGAQGAPASRPLPRAVPRRGGALQAHAPSLRQRAPLLASLCQARPLPLLPTPELAVQSEVAAPTWTGEGA